MESTELHPEEQRLLPLTFSASDEEAESRYREFSTKDPFPEIQSSLLNSADLASYVAATGMIYPFHFGIQKEKMKPASYEVDLLGEYVYWDSNSNLRSGRIEAGEEFELPKNSIAFLELEPMFRLPEYIAMRFNLRVRMVYRGLLLGTGPLVDPGYQGKLYIPLHNLTSNSYSFVGGSGLIWAEFTKISPNRAWAGVATPAFERIHDIQHFPADSLKPKLWDFIRRAAAPSRMVMSSMSELISEAESIKRQTSVAISDFSGGVSLVKHNAELAEESARLMREEAKTSSERWLKEVQESNARLLRIGWLALAGLLITLAGLVGSTWYLFKEAFQVVADSRAHIEAERVRFEQRVEEVKKEMEDFDRRQQQLEVHEEAVGAPKQGARQDSRVQRK